LLRWRDDAIRFKKYISVHTLLFYEPAHFHAALTLRNENPRVATEVHLYARPGAGRTGFLDLVDAFNARETNPTRWRVRVHQADDPLDRLIEDRNGDIVVLAGRNSEKLAIIARLHASGFNVLADKPWLTSSAALPDLHRVTEASPLAMDIMTERHDVLARLRRRVVSTPQLFGDFARDSERPAIEIASVHHLYKVVNGQPLRRPWWYYDVAIQGDGLVDIQSHLTDQVQWMVMGDEPGEFARDIELHAARRWTTPVSLALYRESTGQAEFPEALHAFISDGVLALPCNAEIDYSIKGVRVRQRAEWGQREPSGSGDLHPCVIRGTRCKLLVRHGPETGYTAELHLEPVAGTDVEAALEDAIAEWQSDLPGLGMRPADKGFKFTIPDALHSTHESHFAMVLENFLDYVDKGHWPVWLTRGIRTRYELLARSRELALA
jgi:predicted dehydrogenase